MTIASCVDGGDGNLLSIEDDTTIHGLAVKKTRDDIESLFAS